jgi:hypothetical protein
MNTNTARKTRATFALISFGVAVYISLYIIADAIRYNEKFSFYVGGMALTEAIWAYGIGFALLGWNAVTYNRPRYARSRG